VEIPIRLVSPYRGVSFHNSTQRWRCRLKIKKRCIHLGYFASDVEAAYHYNKAALNTHGEKAVINKGVQEICEGKTKSVVVDIFDISDTLEAETLHTKPSDEIKRDLQIMPNIFEPHNEASAEIPLEKMFPSNCDETPNSTNHFTFNSENQANENTRKRKICKASENMNQWPTMKMNDHSDPEGLNEFKQYWLGFSC